MPRALLRGRRTFGYQRTEVLAALVNGLLLVAVAVAIAFAAIGRLGDPPGIDGAGVLALGLFGLAGNMAATVVLAGGRREDINLEGALRHRRPTPSARSASCVAGAFVLPVDRRWSTRWSASLIAALILASSWRLIKEPFDVLMEAAPEGLDVDEIGAAICARRASVRSTICTSGR